MPEKRFTIYCAGLAILLTTLSCALPISAPAATPTQERSNISALAATQTALAEKPAPTSQPSPTSQPQVPTETISPTPTLTETPTLPVGVFPTETPAPASEPISAEVMRETNCRTGPGAIYDLVTIFQTGTLLEVAARDLGGGFIVVKNPDQPEVECYILSNNVKLTGDPSILPQYTPLASPTASPNFAASFKKFDTCKGDVYAQFIVQNTGSVPFRSAYIRVLDLRTNQKAEQVVNAFDQTVGCIIAKNVAPLNPGVSAFLSSALFKNDPRGNKLRATIQACTEKALKGTCVIVSVDIKP
ncbi:MAG: hypothetical protein NT121_08910 [Chloroflexi bacterium]|nr:hypothetical protein [Chloroflexota bacterium]